MDNKNTTFKERFDPNIRSRLVGPEQVLGMCWEEWIRRLDEWSESQGRPERTNRDRRSTRRGGNGGSDTNN